MTEEKIELSKSTCKPCSGNEPAMPLPKAMELLQKLHEAWAINEAGHLERVFLVKNFVAALDLANKFGDLAEKEGHHPDLTVSYGKLRVEMWTHKINGLSLSDFVLASKIDDLAKIILVG